MINQSLKTLKMKKKNLLKIFTLITLPAFLMFQSAIAQKTEKLTDPEIASVAVAANQIDIDYAQIAFKNTKNASVLEFAKTMSNDHKAVIDQAVALVTKLKVTPQTNDLTKKLMADAAKTRKELSAKKGKAFDKAYINNEVAYHKAVISVVETMLIPQSSNAELKSLLENVLPALKAHLSHAEMVQKTIAK